MNFKLVALAGCAAYGIWFAAVGGKQVSEAHVAELYRQYASAYDRGDGEAVCKLFSDDVHGKFSSTSRAMPVREVVNKDIACASVDEFYASKKQLEASLGHELHTNIEYTIHSIRIAPDKRSATAEVLLELRLGTENTTLLDMRSTQTDVIKRSFGKAQCVQTDGVVRFYR